MAMKSIVVVVVVDQRMRSLGLCPMWWCCCQSACSAAVAARAVAVEGCAGDVVADGRCVGGAVDCAVSVATLKWIVVAENAAAADDDCADVVVRCAAVAAVVAIRCSGDDCRRVGVARRRTHDARMPSRPLCCCRCRVANRSALEWLVSWHS